MKKAIFEIVRIDVKDIVATSNDDGFTNGGSGTAGGGGGNTGGWGTTVNVNG